MFAHIVGVPVEETALSLAPIAAATAGLAGMRLREQAVRRRARRQRDLTTPRRRR
ncbi:MAG: hypothetical protein WA862_10030 [Solirubrobacterales bacterium]